MERKSLELYVQSAVWVGGVAAAATGGVLLALINHDTPLSLFPWLRMIGAALLVALAAAAYMQFHAIGILNARERHNEEEATASAHHVFVSQLVMLGALGVAALFLGIGLILFRTDERPPVRWTVAGIGSAGSDSIVVMSRADSSDVRILSRRGGEDAWHASNVNGDAPVARVQSR